MPHLLRQRLVSRDLQLVDLGAVPHGGVVSAHQRTLLLQMAEQQQRWRDGHGLQATRLRQRLDPKLPPFSPIAANSMRLNMKSKAHHVQGPTPASAPGCRHTAGCGSRCLTSPPRTCKATGQPLHNRVAAAVQCLLLANSGFQHRTQGRAAACCRRAAAAAAAGGGGGTQQLRGAALLVQRLASATPNACMLRKPPRSAPNGVVVARRGQHDRGAHRGSVTP